MTAIKPLTVGILGTFAYTSTIPSCSFTFASIIPSCSFTFTSIIPSCSFTFARVIPTNFTFLLKLFYFTLYRSLLEMRIVHVQNKGKNVAWLSNFQVSLQRRLRSRESCLSRVKANSCIANGAALSLFNGIHVHRHATCTKRLHH